jgi:hypothetical protein
MGLFDFFEGRVVARELETLHREQKPVRVEIENRGVRFKTLITLRKDVVAVARPLGFKWELPAGTVLRVRVPGARREVRLRIANPDFRLPNGRSFFVCPMPKEFAAKSPRESERYSTMRFKNLDLMVPAMGSQFRILDLSLNGCRIDMGQQNLEAIWNLGEGVGPAEVRVGGDIRIPLAGIVPRVVKEGTLGLEFQIESGSKTVDYLAKLVKWLDKQEDRLSRVVTAGETSQA